MMERADTARRTFAEQQAADDNLASQVKAILQIFHNARQRHVMPLFCAGLVVVIGATAYGQIKLNAWNRL